jgi:hypothetical protein
MTPRRTPAILLAAVLAAALGGCGLTQSTPTDFYLLDPIRPGAERPTGGGVRLALEEVEIPAYLDRQDLVTRDSDTQLRMSALHQWAEPLSANATRVLAENLRLLLDETEVVMLPSRQGGFNAELQVELLRFERGPDGAVTLVATWLVLSGDRQRELLRQRAVIREPVAGSGDIGDVTDYPATVSAMSAALGALSQRIADNLERAGAAA